MARQDRINRGRHFRHVGQIIVDRLGFAVGDVAQNVGHAAFGLAGEQMDAEIERFLQVGRQSRQHGDAAGHMKAAHDHGQPQRAEFSAEIERARILVGLHADQPDHAAARGTDAFGHGGHIDDGVALVAGLDLDIDVGAEHAVVGALPHQPIDAGERVRRQGRAQPLDDIAVPVVMRRLDQLDPKRALGQIPVQNTPPRRNSDGPRQQSPATLRVRPPRLQQIPYPLAMLATPSPRVRGEGGVRGLSAWAQNCGAQNRGVAPSPSFAEPVIGPATSGRTRWLSRPLPARRGEVMRDRPRNASAPELSRHGEERSDEAIQHDLADVISLAETTRTAGLDCFASLAMTNQQ